MERLAKHQSVSEISAQGIVICLRGVAHWHTAVAHHTGTPHSSICSFADGLSNYQNDRRWTVGSSQLHQKNKRNFEAGYVLLIVDFLSLLSHALSTHWTCSHPASCLQTSVGRRASSTAVRPYSPTPSFTNWTVPLHPLDLSSSILTYDSLLNALQTSAVHLLYPACNCLPVSITSGPYWSLLITNGRTSEEFSHNQRQREW